MYKSKFRKAEITKLMEDKYYEVLFLILCTKQNKLDLWAEFTNTNINLLNTALFKLKLSNYTRMKYFKMRALAYFGVTVQDIKNVFGYSANYNRIPEPKNFYSYTVCNEEEINEIRTLIDNLIYLLWFFRYVKFDENGIVLKEYKEYNKVRICELFVRTSLFYFDKRYRKVYANTTVKPVAKLCKLVDINATELMYINQKLHSYNLINLGEMRSLLYYAFGISVKDAKELLQYKQPSLYYIHQKYADKRYMSVLNEDEFYIIKKFLRNIYDNTKYICCLKGVDKNE